MKKTERVSDKLNISEPKNEDVNQNSQFDKKEPSPLSKLLVIILAFSILGAGVGLGLTLFLGKNTERKDLPMMTPPTTVAVDKGTVLSSEDPLKQWNIELSSRISPLVSQLARKPRVSLGAQIELCKEQRNSLQGLMDFRSAPKPNVKASLERYINNVESALNYCVNIKPTGSDEKDIKKINAKIRSTSVHLTKFLKSLEPTIKMSILANPDSYEIQVLEKK
jgi:hypothetical protein